MPLKNPPTDLASNPGREKIPVQVELCTQPGNAGGRGTAMCRRPMIPETSLLRFGIPKFMSGGGHVYPQSPQGLPIFRVRSATTGLQNRRVFQAKREMTIRGGDLPQRTKKQYPLTHISPIPEKTASGLGRDSSSNERAPDGVRGFDGRRHPSGFRRSPTRSRRPWRGFWRGLLR